MPRQRDISPRFFVNEELFEAERAAQLPLRVAFAGLWCVADREGRFEWRPRVLKLDVLPYDVVDFELVLEALLDAGFIDRYEVDGRTYGRIVNFLKHQKPHPREAPSRLPAPPDVSCSMPVPDEGQPKANPRHAQGSPRDSTSRSVVQAFQAFGSSGLSGRRSASAVDGPDTAATAALEAELTRGGATDEQRDVLAAQMRAARSPAAVAGVFLGELQGMHGPAYTPAELAQALSEMQAAGKEFGPRLFRGYLAKLREAPRVAGGDRRPGETRLQRAARLAAGSAA